jgi:hypothetical protein
MKKVRPHAGQPCRQCGQQLDELAVYHGSYGPCHPECLAKHLSAHVRNFRRRLDSAARAMSGLSRSYPAAAAEIARQRELRKIERRPAAGNNHALGEPLPTTIASLPEPVRMTA